jgi:very-short-patch-repair endonuclease
MIFRGSQALRAGLLTRAQLRGPAVTGLFRDVYADAGTTVTHPVRCRGATLVLPADAVITGRSAATIRSCPLARAHDAVEVVAPLQRRITWRDGIDLRRTGVARSESEPWYGGRIATPLRMGLDLALDRPLPDAVADIDAVLRAGLVDRDELAALVARRSDRGIVAARRAVGLTDVRAESRPESKVRVWLVLAGLRPVPQYWIEDASGPIARVDLAFPEHRLAVEYDGEWRNDQLWALNHDRERLNRVHALGWDIVFVTRPLLATPSKMIYTVEAALRASSGRPRS